MGRERQGTETGQYRTGLQAWRDGFGYEAAELEGAGRPGFGHVGGEQWRDLASS